MSREVMIPLAAVESLINSQRDFNRSLLDLLGSHLERAARDYRDALNPPLESSPSVEMSYTGRGEEAEDLLHQIEMGIINPGDVTSNMRKILADADLSIET